MNNEDFEFDLDVQEDNEENEESMRKNIKMEPESDDDENYEFEIGYEEHYKISKDDCFDICKMASEIKMEPDDNLVTEIHIEPDYNPTEIKVEPDCNLTTETKMALENKMVPDRNLPTEIKMVPDCNLATEIKMALENKMVLDRNLATEIKMVPDCTLATEIKMVPDSKNKMAPGSNLTQDDKIDVMQESNIVKVEPKLDVKKLKSTKTESKKCLKTAERRIETKVRKKPLQHSRRSSFFNRNRFHRLQNRFNNAIFTNNQARPCPWQAPSLIDQNVLMILLLMAPLQNLEQFLSHFGSFDVGRWQTYVTILEALKRLKVQNVNYRFSRNSFKPRRFL